MGELTSALDMLAGDDLFDLSAAGLLERTAELVRVRNRLDAELARTVRRAELAQACEYDGSKSMASWLRGHARLSPSAAAQMVRNGRALESLPAVAAAWAAGAVTAEQVAVIAPVVKPEHVAAAAEQGVDLSEVDVVLADTAATRQHVQLGRVVQHYLSRLDPDGPEPDPTGARSLSICRHTDGSRTFRGELDAVGRGEVRGDVGVLRPSRPPGRRSAHPRPAAGRRAGAGRRRRPHLGQAAGPAHGQAARVGHHPARRPGRPGDRARRRGHRLRRHHLRRPRPLAGLRRQRPPRIVIGPEGQPLHLGRSKRVVPPHLRRAVELRDRTCVFAGCYAPSYWCDVHHLVHWIDGGDTSLENSGLLCERHHTKVHHGFRVVRQPDGRWRTYRPNGTEILIAPPL